MGNSQRTLIIVKPDGVQRGLVGTIISAFEQRGLRLAALKLIQLDRELAEQHYSVHHGKPFFGGLVEFIISAPVVVGVMEGPDAIQAVRTTMGATSPAASDPGSIRGQYALEIGHNLIHGSDSEETAAYEIGLYFQPHEILSYTRDVDRWIGH